MSPWRGNCHVPTIHRGLPGTEHIETDLADQHVLQNHRVQFPKFNPDIYHLQTLHGGVASTQQGAEVPNAPYNLVQAATCSTFSCCALPSCVDGTLLGSTRLPTLRPKMARFESCRICVWSRMFRTRAIPCVKMQWVCFGNVLENHYDSKVLCSSLICSAMHFVLVLRNRFLDFKLRWTEFERKEKCNLYGKYLHAMILYTAFRIGIKRNSFPFSI